MPRSIGILVYPGFELLDAAGPISVFGNANMFVAGAYSISVLALRPGPVKSDSGAALHAVALPNTPLDTLIVAGGMDWRVPSNSIPTMTWLKTAARRARRVASVCTGAFVLAQAGLLNGRTATTHWNHCNELARRFPQVSVAPDRIYTRKGRIWTSAGVSAGIDLSLALVGEDLGEEIARRTAQELVVYHRRPGGQSQFSALVQMDRQDARFARLLDWMRSHLNEPLTVERLADVAAMSPRHFCRVFTAETGLTPAKAVERLRVEAARAQIESSNSPIERIGDAFGFADQERMRRAFIRAFGQPPQAIRRAARNAAGARQ